MPRKFSRFVQEKVRRRANFYCEYCRTDERWQLVQFTIDHIVPISEGGSDDFENLALACFHCNRKKSNKQTAFDSQTNSEIPIFNPRRMIWSEHFIWSKDGLQILPKSKIGQVTIDLLQLNRERLLTIRADDIQINRHPPENDSIEN